MDEAGQEHRRMVLRKITWLLQRVGKQLDVDIFYRKRMKAKYGQLITNGLVMELFRLDSDKITFRKPSQDDRRVAMERAQAQERIARLIEKSKGN
jgi:hypothetical protein